MNRPFGINPLSLLVILAVLLSALALGASTADAVEAGPVCETGVLTQDNRCLIEDEPGEGEFCPAIEDGQECYELVPAVLSCPDDFGLVDGVCILPVPDVPGAPQCDEPFELTEDERCVTEVEPLEDFICAAGAYDEAFASCVDEFGPPETTLVCPDLEDDDGCYTREAPVEQCPAGAVDTPIGCLVPVDHEAGEPECPGADFNVEVEFDDGIHCGVQTAVRVDCGNNEAAFHTGDGICREGLGFAPCAAYVGQAQFVLQVAAGVCFDVADTTLPGSCPDGTQGVPGDCYILVAKGPGSCLEGVLSGNSCEIKGEPPVNGPATCPVSATVIQDGNECYTLIAPIDGICPPPTTPDPDSADCRRLVDLRPGALQCADGFGIVNGECVRYAPVTPATECPTGSVEDDVGDCRKPVDVGIEGCPPGFELDPNFEACSRELGPAFVCPADYEFDGEECFRTFPGAIDCPADFPEFLDFDNGRAFCWRDYGLLVAPVQCPAGSVEILGGCGVPVDPEFVCEVGEPIDVDCRVAQEPIAGDPFCLEGDLIDGSCLSDYGPPEFVTFCPEGIDLGSTCEVEGPAPTNETTCGPALGSPGACFIEVGANSTCPTGTTFNGDDVANCRLPVERIGGDCGFGFDADDAACVRYEDPTWFCAGEIVTINMTLGDSGIGGSADDVILGTSGPDIIRGNGGDDLICALAGADIVGGGTGNDRIYGGEDNDTLSGNNGRDFLFGENGEDVLNGNNGGDTLLGGADNDTVRGGNGRDSVQGGPGDDILSGNRGRDVLIGDAGNDQLFGGAGRDYLKAGAGTDTCNGQAAPDSFRSCETIIE